MKLLHSSAVLWVLAATACGGNNTTAAPRTADAAAAIAAANAVATRDTPQATLHLKLARDQLAKSQALMRDGEMDEAQLMLERSQVDAELALILAREHDAQQKAAQARQQVEALPAN